MKFLRVAVTNPSPSSLLGKDLVVSNDFGATHIPYLMLHWWCWLDGACLHWCHL